LLALQQQIGFSEQRVAHQPPLWTRFGLNQDKAIFAALWPSYTTASKSLLIAPIKENLEATLVDLSQMPTDSLDNPANAAALEGHKALKAYLMLAEPNRVGALQRKIAHPRIAPRSIASSLSRRSPLRRRIWLIH
jgi:type VI secretion system protein ImpL